MCAHTYRLVNESEKEREENKVLGFRCMILCLELDMSLRGLIVIECDFSSQFRTTIAFK